MKITKRDKLRNIIDDCIGELRLKLKLSPSDDFELAQLKWKIWDRQKVILYPEKS